MFDNFLRYEREKNWHEAQAKLQNMLSTFWTCDPYYDAKIAEEISRKIENFIEQIEELM